MKVKESERLLGIAVCENCLRHLRKPHWSWDILIRPFRIMYYKYKLRKLSSQPKE